MRVKQAFAGVDIYICAWRATSKGVFFKCFQIRWGGQPDRQQQQHTMVVRMAHETHKCTFVREDGRWQKIHDSRPEREWEREWEWEWDNGNVLFLLLVFVINSIRMPGTHCRIRRYDLTVRTLTISMRECDICRSSSPLSAHNLSCAFLH